MNELHLCLVNYILYMPNTAPRLLKDVIIIQAEMGSSFAQYFFWLATNDELGAHFIFQIG